MLFDVDYMSQRANQVKPIIGFNLQISMQTKYIAYIDAYDPPFMKEWYIHTTYINMVMTGGWFMTLFYPYFQKGHGLNLGLPSHWPLKKGDDMVPIQRSERHLGSRRAISRLGALQRRHSTKSHGK